MKAHARIGRWLAASVVVLAFFVGHASGRDEDRRGRSLLRVLFIGNSYTRFNNLPRMVRELSESVERGPVVQAARETHGGFDLRRHWRRRRVRAQIDHGDFDTVVIQDHSLAPIEHPDRMEEYARRFSERVDATGARLVLFETWARAPRSRVYRRLHLHGPEDMLGRVDAAYARVGQEVHAAVSPVGRAWERASVEAPNVTLHRRDGTHPTLAGSYLAACVLYGTLTGNDPREASWVPWRLPDASARAIRAIAAESLQR